MSAKQYHPLNLGAHMSISDGLDGAVRYAQSIQATTMQIFTANQRQWTHKKLMPEQIQSYFNALAASNINDVMSHASYLVNLGSPLEEVRSKSQIVFQEEIERCLALKLSYLNFHPGAALDDSREKCLDRIVESILLCAPLLHNKESSLTLLLEMTAGQGSVVGNTFEEVGYILERTAREVPIGVCIDTCHIFAAGYDIRTKEALEKTLFECDRIIGLDMIKALHLNDSQKGLGSKVDRHGPLGEGMIGLQGFRAIVRHPFLSKLPMYLETPGGLSLWEREIALLHHLQKE